MGTPDLKSMPSPLVTVCVLTYGDFPHLIQRTLSSIQSQLPRRGYRLVVGANAVGQKTGTYLQRLREAGAIDELIAHPLNLNKCPIMRLMFERVNTEYIWWFDDDSYVTSPRAFLDWLGPAQAAPASTVMWGELYRCNLPAEFTDLQDVVGFVRRAPWYRGLPPPSWRPGGKGEFNFENRNCGDGRWDFLVGGCWLIRTSAVRALDWPDRRLIKMGDDVLLGEAIRQQGWSLGNIGRPGVAINTETRRGDPGLCGAQARPASVPSEV
ncbi:MAG TPA: glycosyltransferase [Verrucomicrobiae bacterium]|nr:glycosyltransferase [Verrucomicrobiae bacterium]